MMKSLTSESGHSREASVSRPRTSARGFSLIEVVIAVLLVGITLSAIIQAFSQSVRNISQVDIYQTALQLAQNKMNELLLDDSIINDDTLNGTFDKNPGFGWRAQMDTHDIDDLTIDKTRLSTRLLYIRLTVYFQSGGHSREVKLFTIKLVRKPRIGEKGYFGNGQ